MSNHSRLSLELRASLAVMLVLALVGVLAAPPLAVAATAVTPNAAQALPDEFYAEQLAQAGLQVISRQDVDVTRDGEPEAVVLAVGQDCGSCHAQRLVIFSGPLPLADVSLDDASLEVLPDGVILVTQPVRLPDEPFCCPSATYTLQLFWDDSIREVSGVEVTGQFVWGSWISIDHAQEDPRAPLHSVAAYYALLDAGRFGPAYLLLSSDAQSQLLFDDWLAQNQPRGALFPVRLTRVPQTSGQVSVEVHEIEPLPNSDRGSLSYTCSGTWQTVPEAGTWLLSSFVPDQDLCATVGGRGLVP